MKPTNDKIMETFRLISMTDFVIRKYKDELVHSGENWRDFLEKYARITKSYADFLKQPLKLEMFVPCDENGNVLEDPKRWNDYLQFPDSFDGNKEWGELYNYELAKERVLFNGFVFEESQKEALKNNTQLSVSIYTENSFYITHRLNGKWHTWFGLKTVEDLIKCKIELSKTAIKQIGL